MAIRIGTSGEEPEPLEAGMAPAPPPATSLAELIEPVGGLPCAAPPPPPAEFPSDSWDPHPWCESVDEASEEPGAVADWSGAEAPEVVAGVPFGLLPGPVGIWLLPEGDGMESSYWIPLESSA